MQKEDIAREEVIKQSLYASILRREWDKVVKIYEQHPQIHIAKITTKEDTGLHLAITHGLEEYVKKMLDGIDKTDYDKKTKALLAKNKKGDTPLHSAAAGGFTDICDRMLEAVPSLVSVRNNDGETPLFLAALHGHNETFLCLHKVSCTTFNDASWRREDGDTILHCTIRREHFDLTFQIMHLYKDQRIATCINQRGMTPLHVLASKPSAFPSSTRLAWWAKILYHCIIVEPLKSPADQMRQEGEIDRHEDPPAAWIHLEEVRITEPEDSLKRTSAVEKKKPKDVAVPESYRTCLEFFRMSRTAIKSVKKMILRRDIPSDESSSNSGDSPTPVYQNQYFPPNYATACDLIKGSCRLFLSPLGYGLQKLKNIKQRHKWCAQIIDELVKQYSEHGYYHMPAGTSLFLNKQEIDEVGERLKKKKLGDQNSSMSTTGKGQEDQSAQDHALTPLLMAAKNGAIELLKKILDDIPVAIEDVTVKEKKNILHVAVENRQPHIFMEIMKYKIYNSLVEEADADGNNVLHLAAKESKYKPWRIPGAAMQLQWEIKWFQFIKKKAPPHLIFQPNNNDETPEQIFTDSHKKLIEDGSEWLKKTSESCSVVAALIAGVSFATSTAVPGGNDEQSGNPKLKGRPTFHLFAVSSLFALGFSVTALVMFLAILTSRHQPRDFLKSLPVKLLLGLSSLFVSIAALLVSFCAAHFFEITEHLTKVVFISYFVTCLPASFYAMAQFSLYLDILASIFKRVPPPSYKDEL